MQLLVQSSPTVKIIVIKILQHISRIAIPFEVFEEAVSLVTKNEMSIAYQVLHKTKTETKFESSLFLKFLFNYLVSIRQVQWNDQMIESEGQFTVSHNISALLREVWTIRCRGDFGNKKISEELRTASLKIHSLPTVEADILLSLIPGGEFGGLTAGSTALTDKDETVTVIGFSEEWKLELEFFSKSKTEAEFTKEFKKMNVVPEFTSESQKVVALFYD